MKTAEITALEAFIDTRSDWLKNQLENCGISTPEGAFAWAFQQSMSQDTFVEIAIGKTLLHYLREDDTYDTGLLIVAALQHTNLPTKAVLKAIDAINYALTVK